MQEMSDKIVKSAAHEVDVCRTVMIGIRQQHQINVLVGVVKVLDHAESLAWVDVIIQQAVT